MARTTLIRVAYNPRLRLPTLTLRMPRSRGTWGYRSESAMSAFLWHDQCEAARGIKERFGSEKALGCLLGEKLLNFLRVQGNVSGPVYSVVDCIRSRARGIPAGPQPARRP